MAHLLDGLAARHEVAVVYLRSADEPPIDERLRAKCEVVEEIVRPIHRTSPFQNVVTLLGGKPLWAAEWTVSLYAERVQALVRSWKPDVIHIDYHIMGQYLPALAESTAPRVLVQYDPGTRAAWDEMRSGQAPGRVVPLLDLLAWCRFEKKIMSEVDVVVALTERDRKALAPLAGSTPIATIPLGSPVREQPLDPLGRPPPGLLYAGNFMHTPNVDAAVRLATSIFPRVKEQYPELQLYIVGDQPPPKVQQLQGAGIVVTGRVPDMTPYLDQAAIVAVPLRLGGGMRVKVLEALAVGKAIVASPLAIEGLELENGRQVLLAETDDEFCASIEQLLASPHRRLTLAQNARAWSSSHLGWNDCVSSYEQLYASLLHRHGRSQ